MITVLKSPYYENRMSTGAKFVHAVIKDNGVKKEIDVYWHDWDKTGKGTYGLEVYSGSNYVLGSTDRSYSRHYPGLRKVPEKYKPLVSKMYSMLKQKVRK